jgi:hypothetical protein
MIPTAAAYYTAPKLPVTNNSINARFGLARHFDRRNSGSNIML